MLRTFLRGVLAWVTAPIIVPAYLMVFIVVACISYVIAENDNDWKSYLKDEFGSMDYYVTYFNALAFGCLNKRNG